MLMADRGVPFNDRELKRFTQDINCFEAQELVSQEKENNLGVEENGVLINYRGKISQASFSRGTASKPCDEMQDIQKKFILIT